MADSPQPPIPPKIDGHRAADLLNLLLNAPRAPGPWTPPAPEQLESLFPGYHIERMLGRGGMGAVYLARQLALERRVAIKILPTEMAEHPEAAARFHREAIALARLSHPHIVPIFDSGQTTTGLAYFVMEYVDGTGLDALIRPSDAATAPLAPDRALEIVEQVCDALTFAHAQGIVHRDLKPANVLIGRDGRARVADFGVARLMEDETQSGTITMTGALIGTLDYMAPEQKRGQAANHRADIYALGVILYEAVCGETPQGAFELPSRRRGFPKALDAVITRAIAPQPEQRFQTTQEMKAAVTAVRPALMRAQTAGVASPVQRRTRTWVALGTAAAIALAVAIPLTRRAAPTASPVADGASSPVAAAPLAAPLVNSPGKKLVPVPVSGAPTNGQPSRQARGPEPAATPAPAGAAATRVTKAIAPALTGPVNLLARVDAKRDAIAGDWKSTSEGLVLKKTTFWQPLVFDITPPEEYDFEIEFTVGEGQRSAGQVLALADRSILWKISHSGGQEMCTYCFGPMMDAIMPERRTEAVALHPRLKTGRRYRSLVEVRKNSLRALIDGQEVLKWSGDLTRFSLNLEGNGIQGRRVGLYSRETDLTFHKAELRPPGVSASPRKAAPTASPVAGGSSSPVAAAPLAAPLVNSLGMQFRPVPVAGARLLFCIHETRRQDFEAYAADAPVTVRTWETLHREGTPVGHERDHPVMGVSWEQAQAFCVWLSQKEGKTYRLPTDEEWSIAVGLGGLELRPPGTMPHMLAGRESTHFPWGTHFPPRDSDRAGNLGDAAWHRVFPNDPWMEGLDDGFATTAPVMSFAPNSFGLYDMAGNAEEFCTDWFDETKTSKVVRGGSYHTSEVARLLSSRRRGYVPKATFNCAGFRVVLDLSDSAPLHRQAQPAETPNDGRSLSGSKPPGLPPAR